MKRIALVVGIIASLAMSQIANALPVTTKYADVAYNWATWSAATNDLVDPLGAPDILSTSVTMDGSKLNSISFDLGSTNSNVVSGDLFIDVGNDLKWDYVVRSLGKTLDSSTDLDLYALNALDYNYATAPANTYKLSYYNDTPSSYRSGLPVGLLDVSNLGSSYKVGYVANSTAITFDFNGLANPLLFTEAFSIGYQFSCANDVVYQQVPVPEPGTMALLGFGLLGLVVYGKRRMSRES